MDLVITPQPHLIPGYTGHCPQLRFRIGKTYGKLSHKLFVDPCTKHAENIIVTPPTKSSLAESPTKIEVKCLKDRSAFIDSVYQHPIIPGYDGFIPNVAISTGKRFTAAATAGVAKHEALVELMRRERHLLKHQDLLKSGIGLFNEKISERIIPNTVYRLPLIPIQPRSQAFKMNKCDEMAAEQPYSKFSVPHFMENENAEKYIINGYAGHIPMAMTRFGQSNKQLTNSALCEFTNNYRHRKSEEWCPIEMSGIASSSPKRGQEQFIIYHQMAGMVPKYAGHVPGEIFSIGRTYGNSTIDAKNWLAVHKD